MKNSGHCHSNETGGRRQKKDVERGERERERERDSLNESCKKTERERGRKKETHRERFLLNDVRQDREREMKMREREREMKMRDRGRPIHRDSKEAWREKER